MSGINFFYIFLGMFVLLVVGVPIQALVMFLWEKHTQHKVRRKALLGSMVTYRGGSFGLLGMVFIHVPINGERDLVLDLSPERCSVSRSTNWYNYYKAGVGKGDVPMGYKLGSCRWV